MSICTTSHAVSDIGLVREKNEDCHFVDDAAGLYVLADGMGGLPRGEIASKLAVQTVVDFMASRTKPIPESEMANVVRESVLDAHSAVSIANLSNNSEGAMGTTLSVLLLSDGHFTVVSVGDSKCFWLHLSEGERRIAQITRDDTVAASLLLRGTPPEFIRSRAKHTLTQAIGLSNGMNPHVASGMLEPGDMIVMCTDGITDYVDPADFRSTMLSLARAPKALASTLVKNALRGGGGDNCTCICVLAHKPRG